MVDDDDDAISELCWRVNNDTIELLSSALKEFEDKPTSGIDAYYYIKDRLELLLRVHTERMPNIQRDNVPF